MSKRAPKPAQLSQQVLVFPQPNLYQVSVQLPASLSSQSVQATLLNALAQALPEAQLPATAGAVPPVWPTG